jgi:hypothetical protein
MKLLILFWKENETVMTEEMNQEKKEERRAGKKEIGMKEKDTKTIVRPHHDIKKDDGAIKL